MREERQYTIDGTLGSGAFGTVYRARLHGAGGFERTVAIKVLHRERVDPEEVQRLRDEARLLGLLHHRAIVQVHDLLHLDEGWAVVMEYVGGIDLSQVVRAGPLAPRTALQITAEVASALDVAVSTRHEGRALRLVHRDIKPANLRLTAAGEVKVLDFGIARADFGGREAATEDDQVLGTLRYMAPERFEGVSLPESDVYALGVVLLELLGTRLGRLGLMGVERHDAQVEQSLGPVRRHAGRGVAELLGAMLDVDPAKRPSAAEVARRCGELDGMVSGPSLRTWAEGNVATLEEATGDGAPGDRVGERISTKTTREKPASAGMFRWVALAVGVGAVLGAGCLIATGGGLVASVFRPVGEVPAWSVELSSVEVPRPDWRPAVGDRGVIGGAEGCAWMNRDGTGWEALAGTEGVCAAVPSPDGVTVAAWTGEELRLVRDGAPILLRERGVPLAFSPDGRYLAWARTDAADRDGRTGRAWLHVLDVRTFTDRALLDDPGLTRAIWSPDGQHLLAWFAADQRWVRAGLDGSVASTVRALEPVLIAPDGQGFLALGGGAGLQELHVLRAGPDGLPSEGSTLITTLAGEVRVHADSPPWLTRRDAAGSWDVLEPDADEGSPLRLPPGIDDVWPLDEGWLLVREDRPPAGAVVLQLAVWDGVGRPRPVGRLEGNTARDVAAVQDGRVFFRTAGGEAVGALEIATGAVTVRGAIGPLGLRDFRVHPDGTSLALHTAERELVFTGIDVPDVRPVALPDVGRLGGWVGDELVVLDGAGRVGLIARDGPARWVTGPSELYYAHGLGGGLALYGPRGVDRLDLRSGVRSSWLDQPASLRELPDGRVLARRELDVVDAWQLTWTRAP